jgi:DNA-binding response OmpR family regulator
MGVPRRILHVDDDAKITELVAKYLRRHGIDSTAIHDPCRVIQQLPQFQERVVLLDIDMPRINGLELLKEIKEFDGAIQVVMLTGLVTMTTVLQSLRWGAEACFFKPIADVEPMVSGLEACFQKIDRWWSTLDDLSRRRKTDFADPFAGQLLLAQTTRQRI